jgi:LEA14-like dessication related protein
MPRAAARLSVVLVALLAACATAKKKPVVEFPKPRLTFAGSHVERLALDGASLAFDCVVENPLPVPVSLAGATWQLDVEGHRVAAGALPGGLAVGALGSAPVRLTADVRFADVPRFAFSALTKEEVRYRLAVTASMATPAGAAEVPLVHEGGFKGPRMPKVGIDGVKIRSIGMRQTALELRLEVANLNDFPLPTGSLGYEIRLAGKKVAAANGVSLEKVPAKGKAVVAMPVEVSLLGAGGAVVKAVRTGRLDAQVVGTATFAGLPVPVDVSRTVDAER